jgi:hypothetical protein
MAMLCYEACYAAFVSKREPTRPGSTGSRPGLGQSTGAQQLESQETGTPARSQYEPLQRHEDIFLAFRGVQVWIESSTKQPAKKAAQHVLLQPRPVPAMRGSYPFFDNVKSSWKSKDDCTETSESVLLLMQPE